MKLLKLMQDVWALNQVSKIIKRLVKYLGDHPDIMDEIEKSIYIEPGQLVKVLNAAESSNRQRIERLTKVLSETDVEAKV